jgi:KaiC/GvpD/RAD55 family RecA-like ATPase
MPEDNVFIPSKKTESGFSIKSSDSGIQIKKIGDSLGNEANEEYDDKELDIQRVNDGNDFSRVKSGINGFDELIQGGFERESIVLVVGASGTGKTILSMQFLYSGAALFNEPGVFLSFEEDRDQLYRQAEQFGWDFAKLEKEDKFRLLTFKPHQITKILEEGGGQVKDALIEIKAKRIVIDSITAYGLLFHDEYKRREKILEFFNMLRKWGVTSLVICEEDPELVEKEEGGIGFISDAIVSLYYEHDKEKGIRIHSLEVIKMRGTKHTNKVCAINFEKDGVTVYPDVEIF